MAWIKLCGPQAMPSRGDGSKAVIQVTLKRAQPGDNPATSSKEGHMRSHCTCVILALTVAFCAPAAACSLDAMRALMTSSDDHVEWADFWSDLDPREARAELGYAQADLRALGRMIESQDCDHDPSVTAMRRSLVAATAACTRRQTMASVRP
jgi:hypothetical protein